MSALHIGQNRRMLRLVLALVFGLTLLIGLFLATGATQSSEMALAQGGNVRYVDDVTGNDGGNDCITSTTPCATIQRAVDVADPGDEIRVATGIYTGVQARAGISQVVYVNQTVIIRGGFTITNWTMPYPITQPTLLDARGQGRALYVTGDISPTIEGLCITGGNAAGLEGSPSGDSGGGVYIITATAIIHNSQVFSNTALIGGGLYFQSSNGTLLVDNLISDNNTPTGGIGGGLYFGNSSRVTLMDNTISDNEAGPLAKGYGFGGGAVFDNSPEAMLHDNVVCGNRATNEGGLRFSDSSTATLIANTISDNTADHAGSGLKHNGGVAFDNSDNATLIGNTISGNRAASNCGGVCFDTSDNAMLVGNAIVSNTRGSGWDGFGAGARFSNSKNASLVGNMISNNTGRNIDNLGTILGGGLHIGENSTVTLISNTISSNGATQGGGLYVSDSTVALMSDIITGNTVYDSHGVWLCHPGGGGLYLNNSTATLTNVVIADNQTETEGSGLYIQGSSPHLLHTTIARNSGGDGSGIYITGTTSAAVLTNTILVSHTVGITVAADSMAALNGVLWYNNTINYGGMGAITVTNEYTGDPAFAADGYHLTLSSEAIDKGIRTGVTADIDDEPRPAGTGYDIGADEYYGPVPDVGCFIYLPVILRHSG